MNLGCDWPLAAGGSMRKGAAAIGAALSPRVRMRSEPFSFQVAAGCAGVLGIGHLQLYLVESAAELYATRKLTKQRGGHIGPVGGGRIGHGYC